VCISALPFGLMSGPKALKNHLWLLSFFLFCSLRQNRSWIGVGIRVSSPDSVTITWEVYLNTISYYTWTPENGNRLTQKCALSHPCLRLSLWGYPPGNIPSKADKELPAHRQNVHTTLRTWRVRLLILWRPSETTQTTTFFQPSFPHIFERSREQR